MTGTERTLTADTVTIPRAVAVLIRQAFVPRNPNKMRNVHPDVVAAAKTFIAAVETPHWTPTPVGNLYSAEKTLEYFKAAEEKSRG